MRPALAVIETHPVQYHAPVYRAIQEDFGVPVTVIYGSDFSVSGYEDREFGAAFAWDTNLLSGYTSVFLSRVCEGGPRTFEEASPRGLRVALQRLKPDAVLVLGYSPHFNRKAFYEAWRARYPILFRGETTDHARQRSSLKASLRDRALRWAYRNAAKLLYIGERSYRHYRRLGCPDEKLVFSPYCVDASVFQCDEAARAALRSGTRRDLKIPEPQSVLLFSGKLSPRKGPDLLLTAVKALPSAVRENVVVMFLGSGEVQGELQSLAQSEPITECRFVGFQNQTQLSRYYHAADLLVLPSRERETWGLVVNEALHHGVPCVVSDAVGCTPDLIDPGATGEICETGSVQSLASAVTRALALIGRSQIRAKCQEKVSAYSIQKAAEGLASAYNQVVRPARSVHSA
jgi:glycosyltransferase involved in cell wall biosynthesis